jgi:aspartate/methionine/tyrosine aminotransferase
MAMSREASRREAAGQRILHLEIGQPSTGAPRAAVRAAAAALNQPLGYTDAPGTPALRTRIAELYAHRHGLEVACERIMVVAGASAGFTLAFLAAFDTGARVGVVEPGYPCYRNTLLALGMEPVAIPVGPETRWAPTPQLLNAAGRLDGLILASPSNPTGTVLGPAALGQLAQYCRQRDIRLIADEIYHGITYTGPATSALAVTDQAVVVNSFSKYHSMTGWRIGWMVVPDDLVDAVERLQQNLYICAPHVSQVAALAALEATEELEAHVVRYRDNRAVLLDGLATAGIDQVADADGAFYVYAEVSHLIERLGADTGTGARPDSMALCQRWLDEIGVACTPGIDFDLARGGRSVRFSYAGQGDHIAAACELLARWSP